MSRLALKIVAPLVGLVVLLPVVAAIPVNDAFAAAKPMMGLTGPLAYVDDVDTTGATTEAGEAAPCGLIGSTVWYRYTPLVQARTKVDTTGSGYDTVIAIYRGTTLADLVLILCVDDVEGSLQAVVTFLAKSPNTYFVQVGGFAGAQGSLHLVVDFTGI